ncbi:MAG TPA: hypothetical protein VKB80_24890 [Kofleriaceae bacterium]|nr:hypothetical protein [Kofleriaceae bacterium]
MSPLSPRLAFASALLAATCSGGHSSPHQDNHDDDSSGEALAAPGSGATMSDFQKALVSFRQAAGKRLKRPESALHVVPDADNQVGLPDAALPPFIAFQADVDGVILRGLASPGGQVALVSQGAIENVGALLEAAHALDPARALPAVEIARRIAWLFGPTYSLIAPGHATWKATAHPPAGSTQPVLVAAADGSAELRFLVNQAGETGVVLAHQIEIRVAPGYRATATIVRVAP